MATLTSQQLKDSYQSLVTIGDSITSNPTSGVLENGLGNPINELQLTSNSSATVPSITIKDTDTTLVTNQTIGRLNFEHSDTDNAGVGAKIEAVSDFNNGNTRLSFFAGNPTSLDEKLRIRNTGDIIFFDDADNEAFYWDASTARLGIGTQTPSVPLEVDVSGAGDVFKLTRDTGTNGELNIDFAGANANFASAQGGYTFTTSSVSSAMTINSSGNVGIGTSPSEKLEVQDGSISVGSSTNTSTTNTLLSGYGYILSGTKLGNTSIKSTYNNSNNSASLEFYTDPNGSTPTERMRIDSSGNVDIKTVGSETSPSLFFGGDGDTGFFKPLSNTLAFSTFGAERMRIDSSGRVGIGEDDPSANLNIKSSSSTNSDNLGQVLTNSEFRLQYRSDDLSSLYIGGLGSERGYLQGVNNAQNAGADISLNPYGGNVGIGVSPMRKLHIDGGSISSDTPTVRISSTDSSGTNKFGIEFYSNSGADVRGKVLADNNGRVYIDDNGGGGVVLQANGGSGNVGIGDVPKTQHSNVTDSLNVGSHLTFQRTKDTYISSNFYYNSSDVGKSIASGYSPVYLQDVINGKHQWFNGTASATGADETVSIQPLMTIDSSGNVGIGVTSVTSGVTLDVAGTIKGGIANKKGTYTDGDTTPSVAGISYLRIANTVATTITDFDDAVEGQVIYLEFANSNTTVNRSNAYLSGGTNFTGSANDMLVLFYSSSTTLWHEISRSVNS